MSAFDAGMRQGRVRAFCRQPLETAQCSERAGRLFRELRKHFIDKFWLAGGLGFEPRLAESESAVLPLDDPPMA